MEKVGIIGTGFVGESMAYAFSPTNEIRIFDVKSERSNSTIEEVMMCDYVFICVPTPMNDEGKHDLTYIENVFRLVKSGPIYIIKSSP